MLVEARDCLAGLALLGATACSATVPGAAAPTPAPTAGPAADQPPRPAFGAYLDASMSFPDLATLAGQTGLKHVVLSFVLAKGGACEPAWGGTEPMDSLKGSIESFRAAGGSVTAATGGAEGAYLENVCANPTDLAAAYTKILDATGTNLLDVDIEQDVQIDKVIGALGQLQRDRGTDITLTLPVDLEGLGPGQLNLVKKAAATKLDVTVNIMDMNLDAGGDFGKAMVRAAQTVLTQLRKVYPNDTKAEQYRRLGITMMIGRNDTGRDHPARGQPDGAGVRQDQRRRQARHLVARTGLRHLLGPAGGAAGLQRDRAAGLRLHPPARGVHRPDARLTGSTDGRRVQVARGHPELALRVGEDQLVDRRVVDVGADRGQHRQPVYHGSRCGRPTPSGRWCRTGPP